MKHIKGFALGAMAGMALFAIVASSASATTLEDGNGIHPAVIDLSLP